MGFGQAIRCLVSWRGADDPPFMNVDADPQLCWICSERPANTSEHRFKASDIRAKAPGISQAKPLYLQRQGEATNEKIGGAKAKILKFLPSICARCNDTLTQPYDVAWQTLSNYLHVNWPLAVKRRAFDLSRPFPGATRKAALRVHLYFVKLFGCKIREDNVPISLTEFSAALLNGTANPEVSLFVADSVVETGKVFLGFDSEVCTLRANNPEEIHGAVWTYVIYPVTIKVVYMKTGAPIVPPPGHRWHPSEHSKFVRLSPYYGLTEPAAGAAALLP